jgi:isoleucyl-tRNA synthetase
VRTRQPLPTVHVKLPVAARGALSPDPATDAELTSEVIDELNVRAMELLPDASELIERTLYPLLPVLGPRHGRAVGAIMGAARSGDWTLNDDGTVTAGGITLQPDEFELTARARAGHEVAEDGDLLVALDTTIDDDLAAEGLAREVAHRLQALRRSAGYEISDRVRVAVGADLAVVDRLAAHREWLADELLATSVLLAPGAAIENPDLRETATLDGVELELSVARA